MKPIKQSVSWWCFLREGMDVVNSIPPRDPNNRAAPMIKITSIDIAES